MSNKELMEAVANEIKVCRKCKLWKTRRNAVPGEGSLDASILFVGEAPGYWEDVKGRPFVGAAGKLLDEMLSRIGLSRSEVYIANLLKCRPLFFPILKYDICVTCKKCEECHPNIFKIGTR